MENNKTMEISFDAAKEYSNGYEVGFKDGLDTDSYEIGRIEGFEEGSGAQIELNKHWEVEMNKRVEEQWQKADTQRIRANTLQAECWKISGQLQLMLVINFGDKKGNAVFEALYPK